MRGKPYTRRAVEVNMSSNSMMVLQPYWHAGTWVFDDWSKGLDKEPFVCGIPEIIDAVVRDIPDARVGFRLLFSASPFPGYTVKLIWRRAESGGNWYYSEQHGREGWLCPALFKYFDTAPKELYAKAEPLSGHQSMNGSNKVHRHPFAERVSDLVPLTRSALFELWGSYFPEWVFTRAKVLAEIAADPTGKALGLGDIAEEWRQIGVEVKQIVTSGLTPEELEALRKAAADEADRESVLVNASDEWRQVLVEAKQVQTAASHLNFEEREELRTRYGMRLIQSVRAVVVRASAFLTGHGDQSTDPELLLKDLRDCEERLRCETFIRTKEGLIKRVMRDSPRHTQSTGVA